MVVLAVWGLGCSGVAFPETEKAAAGAEMVLVPAGGFMMGTGDGEIEARPPHRRDLPAYYIDRHEVTNAEYAKFVAATGATPPATWGGSKPPSGWENHPVTDITWFEAMRYAMWAGKRLPTEAEWEKASRGTDGRRYAWGNKDVEANRNLDTQKLEAVGSRPGNLSPCGAADMIGNAWEWTADWYDAYPGTSAKSVHFGRKYKVVRGGGGEYLYSIPNPGNTTQRARLLAYGSHDFVGFRCAKSVTPNESPYDRSSLLTEAENLLNASLHKPVPLSNEAEFAGLVEAGRFRLRILGEDGQRGGVRTGIPFSKGVLKDSRRVCVVGENGTARATQSRVLSRWNDGSARWLLLDFLGEAGETCSVDFLGRVSPPESGSRLTVVQDTEGVTIRTGRTIIEITRNELIKRVRLASGAVLVSPMRIRLEAESVGRRMEFLAFPAEKMEVEDAGPVHGMVRLSGSLANGDGPSGFRYDLRIHAVAGTSRLNIVLTITHQATREATASILDASVHFILPETPEEAVVGGDRDNKTIEQGELILVDQPDDLHYAIVRDGKAVAEGTRAAGWIATHRANGWLTLGTRHFWQNHPKALFVTPKSAGIRLWAGKEAFPWEGGLAKTHELILDFSVEKPEKVNMDPLRAVMPPAWACGTEALGGPLLPRGNESLSRFPYWELREEASMQAWARAMATGFRHYGDAYLGGPWKGKNAYADLEYDVHFNFLMGYLRTGRVWYLEAAEAMSRHQADIDTDHTTGQPWKHSPMHTTTRADLGHIFVRGLLLHYVLTGEERSLDVARQIGDWVVSRVTRAGAFGNERQIGWSLYLLSGLYDVTGEERYLKAANDACLRLAEGQAATGRLAIRWDNRISFFNGIGMNGMLTVYEHSRDERIAEAVMKIADRTFGLYPEYACRTLNAFCWAARRTGDPRFLDILERTWETSMNYLMDRDATASSTHSWHFMQVAARHRLFPLFESEPESLPEAATWTGTRFETENVEVFLKGREKGKPAAVLVILEGMASGRIVLFDAAGRVTRTFDLVNEGKLFQAVTFSLPPDGGIHRLLLDGHASHAWQIHHDAGSLMTVYDPIGRHLPSIFPKAFGFVREDAEEVKITLEAIGEGFHKGTLYDPAGNPVSTVRHFVDRDDKGRYEILLASPVVGGGGPWAVEVDRANVIQTEGFRPYWAENPEELFNPESSQSQ